MSDANKSKKPAARGKLAVLAQPMNVAKTIASQIPFASAGVEMANQLAGHEMEQRLESVESELKQAAQMRALENAAPKTAPPIQDWSVPVREYLQRTVSLAVVYDGGFHSRAQRGRELVQPVAHACIIGEKEILTSKEALELATYAAEHKHGRTVVLAGMAWYEFTAEAPDKRAGICLCRLTQRDENKWTDTTASWRKHGLGELPERLIWTPVRFTVTPWTGQEIGFLHSGEAEDVLRSPSEFAKLQFDASVISHFRRPTDEALKSFVTGVLPGRVLQAGGAVFSRDGTLLGLIADTEHYKSDAGRRAVVRSLLGHPRFMNFKRKESQDAQS